MRATMMITCSRNHQGFFVDLELRDRAPFTRACYFAGVKVQGVGNGAGHILITYTHIQ